MLMLSTTNPTQMDAVPHSDASLERCKQLPVNNVRPLSDKLISDPRPRQCLPNTGPVTCLHRTLFQANSLTSQGKFASCYQFSMLDMQVVQKGRCMGMHDAGDIRAIGPLTHDRQEDPCRCLRNNRCSHLNGITVTSLVELSRTLPETHLVGPR
jgi:hypothetical protein